MIANDRLQKIITNKENERCKNHLLELYANGTEEQKIETKEFLERLKCGSKGR